MTVGRRCMRRIKSGVNAGKPGVGFFPHRTPYLSEMGVSRRIAGQKINMPLKAGLESIRFISGTLGQLGCQHQVPVRVFDIDYTFGPDDADFNSINGSGPHHRQGPADVHAVNRAVIHGKNPEGSILCSVFCQGLVHRSGIYRNRVFAFHQPHAHIQAVGARDHHRGQVPALIGASGGRNRNHPVHERPGDDRCDFTNLAGKQPGLDCQKTAAEPVGITDDSIHPAFLDGV